MRSWQPPFITACEECSITLLSSAPFNPPKPSLQHPRYPPLHARTVGGVVGAEDMFEPRLVLQHARVEPDGASDEENQREPRPEGQRETRHEDEVPEIHRVARIAIGAVRD